MYPNLLGQQRYHHLTDQQMAELAGISRTAYGQKKRSGRFTPRECKKYCARFSKTFEFLFAFNNEIGGSDNDQKTA